MLRVCFAVIATALARRSFRNHRRQHHPINTNAPIISRMQGIFDALRSWVKDATHDLSTMVPAPAADGGALGRPGSQDRLFAGVKRADLTAMFEKEK